MHRLLFALFLLQLIMGCASSEVKPLSGPEQLTNCQFDKITGPSYAINPVARHSVMTFFFYDPTRYLNQYNPSAYQQLLEQPFKVLETGLISQESLTIRKPSLANFRMVDEAYNGKIYQRDRSFTTKLITQNCHVYYARAHKLDKNALNNTLMTMGHSSLTDQAIIDFYGQSSLQEKDLTAKIAFDSGENIWRIDSPRFNGFLLQGVVEATTKEVLNLQLYVELKFRDQWGQITQAEIPQGQKLPLQVVATRSKCPAKLNDCIRTEMVRVQLSLPLLKNQTGDLAIRLYGVKEKTIALPEHLVLSFINGLEQATKLKPPAPIKSFEPSNQLMSSHRNPNKHRLYNNASYL